MINNIVNDIKSLPSGAKAFMLSTTIITMICSYIAEGFNPIGLIGAISGILFVSFVANKKISTYYFGAIFSSIYSYVAFKNGIYGDFMINVFYHIPTQFVGLYSWKKDGYFNCGEEKVKKMSIVKFIVFVIISIIIIKTLYPMLLFMGGKYAIRDASTNVLSIIAMVLMIKGYREQWIFWIAVNSISCYMWLSVTINTGSGYATFIQWIVFLLNSLYGAYNWYKRD